MASTSLNKFGLPPPKFSGRQSEWDAFESKFKAYMKVFHRQYSEVFDKIESLTSEITDATFVDSDGSVLTEAMDLSHQLAWVLINVCEGSSEAVIRSSSTKHGFELWRILKQRYAGSSEMNALSLLTDIVQKRFDMSDFESDLAQFEQKIAHFERIAGEPLQTFVKVAVLIAGTSGPLQSHLRVNSDFRNYTKVRSIALNYVRSEVPTVKPKTLNEASTTSDAMDIGAVWKTKGKSKGKGKDKGKGKGETQQNSDMQVDLAKSSLCVLCGSDQHHHERCPHRWCFRCHKYGHLDHQCWSEVAAVIPETQAPAVRSDQPVGSIATSLKPKAATSSGTPLTSSRPVWTMPVVKQMVQSPTMDDLERKVSELNGKFDSLVYMVQDVLNATKKNSEKFQYMEKVLDKSSEKTESLINTKFKHTEKNLMKHSEDIMKHIQKKSEDQLELERGISKQVASEMAHVSEKIQMKIDEITKSMKSEFVRVSELKHSDFMTVVSDKFESFADAFSDIMKNEAELLNILKHGYGKNLNSPGILTSEHPVSTANSDDFSEVSDFIVKAGRV